MGLLGLLQGQLYFFIFTENFTLVEAPVKKAKYTAVGIRHADHVAPSIRKSWH
jgi:hypothetical protein